MGLFGRKTTTAAASAPPPHHREGCCASASRALCSGIISTILFCIFGLSICALVGRRYYWCFYTTHFGDPGAYWISGGWLDFEDRDLGVHSLKAANFGLWIIGIISAAALLASAFIAFMEFFVSITGNAGRHTAGLSFPMGIILVGILICYIVAAAIEIEKWSNNNVGTSYRVWPSWGWICAIVAGALWFFVGSFSACLGPKYGKAKYAQNTAAGPTEHHYSSSAGAGAAGAGAGAGAGTAAGKKGWFGRNKNSAAASGTPQQNYSAQPFNANAGPNSPTTGAYGNNANRDVEMGGAGMPNNGRNGHTGHTGEGLAAGAGAGAGAAAAAHHHHNQQQTQANTTAPTAPVQQQQKRGMFGRNKVTTPNATSAGDPAVDQPSYANQPRGTQGQGAFADPAAQQGTGPAGNSYPRQDQPRGAWAGSGLSADQGAQKGNMGTTGNMGGNTGTMGNMGSNRAGQGQVPNRPPTGTGGAMPVSQPGRAGSANMGRADSSGPGRKKSGIFSFYH